MIEEEKKANQKQDVESQGQQLQSSLRQGQAKVSVFRGLKTVKLQPVPDLFKELCFYLEICSDGKPQSQAFEKAVIECGGKVSRRLGKHVTHLVWSQGKKKTLEKALEYEDIKIVSSLWLQDTFNDMKLADENDFVPSALNDLLDQVKEHLGSELNQISKSLNKKASQANKKKRTLSDIAQTRLYERRQSELSRRTDSKNKLLSQPTMPATGEKQEGCETEESFDAE